MRYILVKYDGHASIMGGVAPTPKTRGWSYARMLFDSEVVDGIPVSEWPDGEHEIKELPPELTEKQILALSKG